MELGAFSISLALKDMEASRTFYEKFGFKARVPLEEGLRKTIDWYEEDKGK